MDILERVQGVQRCARISKIVGPTAFATLNMAAMRNMAEFFRRAIDEIFA